MHVFILFDRIGIVRAPIGKMTIIGVLFIILDVSKGDPGCSQQV